MSRLFLPVRSVADECVEADADEPPVVVSVFVVEDGVAAVVADDEVVADADAAGECA